MFKCINKNLKNLRMKFQFCQIRSLRLNDDKYSWARVRHKRNLGQITIFCTKKIEFTSRSRHMFYCVGARDGAGSARSENPATSRRIWTLLLHQTHQSWKKRSYCFARFSYLLSYRDKEQNSTLYCGTGRAFSLLKLQAAQMIGCLMLIWLPFNKAKLIFFIEA